MNKASNGTQLESLAKKINKEIEAGDALEGKQTDRYQQAGVHLCAAQETCKKQGLKWQTWITENLKVSYSTASAYMQLHKDKDIIDEIRKEPEHANLNYKELLRKVAEYKDIIEEMRKVPENANMALKGLFPLVAKWKASTQDRQGTEGDNAEVLTSTSSARKKPKKTDYGALYVRDCKEPYMKFVVAGNLQPEQVSKRVGRKQIGETVQGD